MEGTYCVADTGVWQHKYGSPQHVPFWQQKILLGGLHEGACSHRTTGVLASTWRGGERDAQLEITTPPLSYVNTSSEYTLKGREEGV